MFDNNKLGEIRPNQLITTFGPGAIVDAVKDSVTILDLNYWKEKGKKIIDGRLASYLSVDCFYMPRTSYSGDIPATSFPYMHVCSSVKCGRIFDVRDNFDLDRYLKFGVPQNVAMKVDRPRKNSFQPTFLDAEQMQKLFEIVKGTRLELPVLVAAFYGLRRGEVLGLKWDAIDFNRGTLTIKRTVTEATIDGTMKIIEQDSAKTKSSLRTLPLVGSFRDYFQKVKEAQELNKKVCGNCYNYEYDGYVFVNELGERMRPNYLTEYFPKYIAKHGMPKMRFHDLRHSCASLLLANGVPLKQIQEWLGHSDFSTTANIYAHLDYRSKISSAQAMEQGMLLPRSDDFGSRWENVTEQGKITEPDLNPGF